jgi:sugar phosphate isomerase/epimerase
MAIPEVGVFLSTTRMSDPAEACAAVQALGFRVVQIGKLPDSFYTPAGTDDLARLLRRHELSAASLCIVFDGERYTDVETVRRTVGFLPEESLAARLLYARRCVEAAAALGIPLVTFHMGMLPTAVEDAGYQRLLGAVDEVATHAARHGVTIGLETGQETSAALLAFLGRCAVPVKVNFDGANFVAYGTDEPLAALEALYPLTAGVHVKDHLPPAAPGAIGRSCALGLGAARVDETIQRLLGAGWTRPLILETYPAAGADPIETLTQARAYVRERLERAPVHA